MKVVGMRRIKYNESISLMIYRSIGSNFQPSGLNIIINKCNEFNTKRLQSIIT